MTGWIKLWTKFDPLGEWGDTYGEMQDAAQADANQGGPWNWAKAIGIIAAKNTLNVLTAGGFQANSQIGENVGEGKENAWDGAGQMAHNMGTFAAKAATVEAGGIAAKGVAQGLATDAGAAAGASAGSAAPTKAPAVAEPPPAVSAPTSPPAEPPASPSAPATNSPAVHPNEVAGKTPAEIDALAKQKGLISKGPDPMNGKGSYIDPVTGKQRILSHPNETPPAAHVNDPQGNRLDINGNKVDADTPDAHLPIKTN